MRLGCWVAGPVCAGPPLPRSLVWRAAGAGGRLAMCLSWTIAAGVCGLASAACRTVSQAAAAPRALCSARSVARGQLVPAADDQVDLRRASMGFRHLRSVDSHSDIKDQGCRRNPDATCRAFFLIVPGMEGCTSRACHLSTSGHALSVLCRPPGASHVHTLGVKGAPRQSLAGRQRPPACARSTAA